MPLFNTSGIACDHWEIWFFEDGAATKAGKQWGAAEGATTEEVQQKQDDAIAFDKRYAHFFGFSYPPKLSHENSLGPICVTTAAFSAKPDALKQLEKLASYADALKDHLEAAREAADVLEQAGWDKKLPIDTKAFEGYLKQIVELQKRIEETRALIISIIGTPATQIEASLAEVQREVKDADNSMMSLSWPPKPPKKPIIVPQISLSCALHGSGHQQTNCDESGCDTVTIDSKCDENGDRIDHVCTTDHHSGQTVCSDSPGGDTR